LADLTEDTVAAVNVVATYSLSDFAFLLGLVLLKIRENKLFNLYLGLTEDLIVLGNHPIIEFALKTEVREVADQTTFGTWQATTILIVKLRTTFHAET
jgi:hypothetical protein